MDLSYTFEVESTFGFYEKEESLFWKKGDAIYYGGGN